MGSLSEGNRNVERSIRSLENEIVTKESLINTLQKREATSAEILQRIDEPNDLNISSTPVVDSSNNKSFLESLRRPTISKSPKCPIHLHSIDVDDADLKVYRERLHECEAKTINDNDELLNGGLRIPADIWNRLYPYQREGVSWLWGLHRHGVGGILGDEMGLGKSVQIVSFLASLHHSKLPVSGSSYDVAVSRMKHPPHNHISEGLAPVLIVCPGTVLKQWLAEFRAWMPTARVVIIHSSGSGYSKRVGFNP